MRIFFSLASLLLIACSADDSGDYTPPYPQSKLVKSLDFDPASIRNRAPGNDVSAPESDNWAITWSADGHQYAVFGDGVGFATTNSLRASMGVTRIEGNKDNYSAYDVFKTGHAADGWGGKSLGILALGTDLYMFRNGGGSRHGAFQQSEIYHSSDSGSNWTFTGVSWSESDFQSEDGIFSPTFLQFGPGYEGSRDQYVYVYANERSQSVSDDPWDVQVPGAISLFRVHRESVSERGAYEYYTGMDEAGNPKWAAEFAARQPVFEDARNGIMRTSVSYNASLQRYLLITQQVSRFRHADYHMGVYESQNPWGPWRTVVFENPEELGPRLNIGHKTVYWNFSNKWSQGNNFVLVYTGPGPDQWGTIEGSFVLSN